MRYHLLIFAGLMIALFSSCDQSREKNSTSVSSHILEGGWLANDGTVFLFRADGTFHGFDFRKREIWGNWVTLSKDRIGFQSLLHDSYYSPQYAIIDKKDTNQMNYIVTGGTQFISAERLPIEEAEASIKVVIDRTIHNPNESEE